MARLIVGSKNAHKLGEIRTILAGAGIEVVGLDEFPEADEVEETGTTFSDNARLKAQAYADRLGAPVLADDSGLVVDALAGAPGVHSARYAGEGKDDAANNAKVLAELEHVPPAERTARFVCVLALAVPGEVVVEVEGRVDGTIAGAARGAHGFGYDPLFFHPPSGVTFGELTPEAKNRLSHRGRALAGLKRALHEHWDELFPAAPRPEALLISDKGPENAPENGSAPPRAVSERRISLALLGEGRGERESGWLATVPRDEAPWEPHAYSLRTGQEATVVFADIIGFARSTVGMSGLEVLDFLNRYFDLIIPAFEAYGGIVDKYIGDAVLVTFNAVEPVAEHARAAVAAVGEALDVLDDYEERSGNPLYRSSFGINTGTLIVGYVGARGRRELTVAGVNVNVAALMRGLARGVESHCCVGLETARAAKDLIETELHSIDVGPYDSVEAHAVLRWRD